MSAALTTNVDRRLLQTTKFPPFMTTKVDMKKVNLPVIKKWVSDELAKILRDEDDVITDLVFNLIEGPRYPNIKELQISLNGFLDKDAPKFCEGLWKLCISAQENPQGIPKELLEAKKLELLQDKIAEDKAREDARKRQEEERERERDMARVRDRERNERSERGRGRGGRYGRDSDRRPPHRDSRSPPPRRRDGDDFYRAPPPRGTDSRNRRRKSPVRSDHSRSPPPKRTRRASPSRSRSPPRGAVSRDKPFGSTSRSRSPPSHAKKRTSLAANDLMSRNDKSRRDEPRLSRETTSHSETPPAREPTTRGSHPSSKRRNTSSVETEDRESTSGGAEEPGFIIRGSAAAFAATLARRATQPASPPSIPVAPAQPRERQSNQLIKDGLRMKLLKQTIINNREAGKLPGVPMLKRDDATDTGKS
ncbi:hypothetical protein LTR65_007405 [Meristemomyces frigidus]